VKRVVRCQGNLVHKIPEEFEKEGEKKPVPFHRDYQEFSNN